MGKSVTLCDTRRDHVTSNGHGHGHGHGHMSQGHMVVWESSAQTK